MCVCVYASARRVCVCVVRVCIEYVCYVRVVCVRRDRKRESVCVKERDSMYVCVCMYVCVLAIFVIRRRLIYLPRRTALKSVPLLLPDGENRRPIYFSRSNHMGDLCEICLTSVK
jgi:hypothetical protein